MNESDVSPSILGGSAPLSASVHMCRSSTTLSYNVVQGISSNVNQVMRSSQDSARTLLLHLSHIINVLHKNCSYQLPATSTTSASRGRTSSVRLTKERQEKRQKNNPSNTYVQKLSNLWQDGQSKLWIRSIRSGSCNKSSPQEELSDLRDRETSLERVIPYVYVYKKRKEIKGRGNNFDDPRKAKNCKPICDENSNIADESSNHAANVEDDYMTALAFLANVSPQLDNENKSKYNERSAQSTPHIRAKSGLVHRNDQFSSLLELYFDLDGNN